MNSQQQRLRCLAIWAAGLSACGFAETQPEEVVACEGLEEGSCSLSNLSLEALKLEPEASPTDVALNPGKSGQLWVTVDGGAPGEHGLLVLDKVHKSGDSCSAPPQLGVLTATELGGLQPTQTLPSPRALAFGTGRFATCGLQPAPGELAGPALWRPDKDAFAPEATGPLMDWIVESTQCTGLAHQEDNVFWAYDRCGIPAAGEACGPADLVRVNFATEEGPSVAGDDPSDVVDGEVTRYGGLVDAGSGNHTGMAFNPKNGFLFLADPGNNRVLMVDPRFGVRLRTLPSQREGLEHFEGGGFTCGVGDDGEGCWVVADGASAGLQEPSGVLLWNEHLFVTDAQRGALLTYELPGSPPEAALRPVSDIALGHGGLGGMDVDPCGALWIAAPEQQELLRILPRVELVPVVREPDT